MIKPLLYPTIGLLMVSYGYHYVSTNHPNINLPYKEEVFRIERLIMHKMNNAISEQEKLLKKQAKKTIEESGLQKP